MAKKLFTFKIEGWSADAAFCCRAVSFAEAFSTLHEALELFAWQNGIRTATIVCTAVPDPSPDAVLGEAYDAVILGKCER